MSKVVFELSVQEAEKVFEALGKMPYNQVYKLIKSLQQQVAEQDRKARENVRSN